MPLLFRALFTLLLLFGVMYLVMLLSQVPGQVNIVWGEYDITITALFFTTTLILLLLLAFYGGQFWGWLMALPKSIARWRHKKRDESGLEALLHGFQSIQMGDGAAALRQAKRAKGLLPDGRLADFIQAEATPLLTELVPEHESELFAMTKRPQSAFIGWRGLYRLAEKKGQWPAALDYGIHALKINTASPWALQAVFEAHMHLAHFAEALELVPFLSRKKLYALERLNLLESILRLHLAMNLRATDPHAAIKELQKAQRANARFVPPALLHAAVLMQLGKPSAAERVLADFYTTTPRFDVAEKFIDIVAHADARHLHKKAAQLVENFGENPTALLVIAMAYLKAGDLPSARLHALKSVEQQGSKTGYRLLAGLEQQLAPNSPAAQSWLMKAVDAPLAAEPADELLMEYDLWRRTYGISGQSVLPTLLTEKSPEKIAFEGVAGGDHIGPI